MGTIYRYGVAYGGGDDSTVVPIAKASVTLSSSWTGSDRAWSQVVTISGYTITANSKIDLQPSSAVLSALFSAGVEALYVENDNGVLTARLVGTPPVDALTIQCTISELLGSGSVTGADLIAEAYSTEKTYSINDFCVYGGYLYRCISDVTVAGLFDPAKWEKAYVGTFLTEWLNTPEVSEVSY